jgi:hypothetical protein
MRGRPFELGNGFGQGRPPGSPNKKGLILQRLLLENGEEIIGTLIDRAKKGERVALALCIERLIPRLKDVEELPFEEEHTDTQNTCFTPAALRELSVDELKLLERIALKIQAVQAKSDNGVLTRQKPTAPELGALGDESREAGGTEPPCEPAASED